jgi:hypothetical protein
MRRIFGFKREAVTGTWRNLHNEELHNLKSLSCFIKMIKSKKMRCVGFVFRMGLMTKIWSILV